MMTIDVLIPSYNRATFIPLQLESLRILRERLSQHDIKLKVVVSDNHSSPPVHIDESFRSFTSVVRPEQHLPTAEENVVWGIQQCEGEYVWLLGDDDAPVIENAISIIEKIAREKPDYTVANCSGSLVDGTMVLSRTICSDELHIKSLPQFVQSTGFIFVMAGFSCIIAKRDLMLKNLPAFDVYFSTSKIYSLVYWLIDTFWHSKFRYFNEVLVVYKQNLSDLIGNHWEKVAAKQGVFRSYSWTLGQVRLHKKLRERQNIPQGYFSKVLEQTWHLRYPSLPQSCLVFVNQLKDDLHAKGPCRSVSNDERHEFLNFAISEMPSLIEAYALINGPTPPQKQQLETARLALEKYCEFYMQNYFVKSIAGWNIFYIDDAYRALPEEFMDALLLEIRDIAPLSSTYQLVGASLDEIEMKIRQCPNIKSPPRGMYRTPVLMKREIVLLKKWALLLYRFKNLTPKWVKQKLRLN